MCIRVKLITPNNFTLFDVVYVIKQAVLAKYIGRLEVL